MSKKKKTAFAKAKTRIAPFTQSAFAAFHESGHAVIARKLGVGVPLVSAQDRATAIQTPWLLVDRMDTAALIEAFQRDTLLTLAGPIADHRYLALRAVNPTETVRAEFDMFEDYDPDDHRDAWPDDAVGKFTDTPDFDMVYIRASISSVVHLRDGGDPYCISPDRPTIIPISEGIMRTEFDAYEAVATRLVDKHWRAIERVAKAIERRDLDQDELDRLIRK